MVLGILSLIFFLMDFKISKYLMNFNAFLLRVSF